MDIFKLIIYFWATLSLFIFILLLRIPAPYGRHVKKGWGPILQNRVGWILMESPSFFIPLGFLTIFYKRVSSPITLLFMSLWIVHYTYRSFIYPFLLRKRKDIPISIVMSGFFFNLVNSFINSYWLIFRSSYQNSYIFDPRFILGIIFFILGFMIHFKSDIILRSLRKPDEYNYKIPSGFLFDYISAPNYFGEIMEWMGWAIATWSLAGFSFALWTCANLIPRALTNHKWYLKNFEDYPKNRKAVIPYLL